MQRVFKSIVRGPIVETDENETSEIFDDLHVIICMNKLLSTERKNLYDSQESSMRFLPVNSYNKINKLLRILIIYASAAIKDTQIEVYVQNSDSFVDVITNCLKYIGQNVKTEKKVVPFDLVNHILSLIDQITQKSKAIKVDIMVPYFLNIFQ